MKIDVFNKVVKEQLLVCEHLLTGKGHEYAPDAVDESNIDRLAHFKKAAAIIDGTPKEALLGMLTKHLVSISDMCTDGPFFLLQPFHPSRRSGRRYAEVQRYPPDSEE